MNKIGPACIDLVAKMLYREELAAFYKTNKTIQDAIYRTTYIAEHPCLMEYDFEDRSIFRYVVIGDICKPDGFRTRYPSAQIYTELCYWLLVIGYDDIANNIAKARKLELCYPLTDAHDQLVFDDSIEGWYMIKNTMLGLPVMNVPKTTNGFIVNYLKGLKPNKDEYDLDRLDYWIMMIFMLCGNANLEMVSKLLIDINFDAKYIFKTFRRGSDINKCIKGILGESDSDSD
jgi:hypothetical protein